MQIARKRPVVVRSLGHICWREWCLWCVVNCFRCVDCCGCGCGCRRGRGYPSPVRISPSPVGLSINRAFLAAIGSFESVISQSESVGRLNFDSYSRQQQLPFISHLFKGPFLVGNHVYRSNSTQHLCNCHFGSTQGIDADPPWTIDCPATR